VELPKRTTRLPHGHHASGGVRIERPAASDAANPTDSRQVLSDLSLHATTLTAYDGKSMAKIRIPDRGEMISLPSP
jgi:hypothetical protein